MKERESMDKCIENVSVLESIGMEEKNSGWQSAAHYLISVGVFPRRLSCLKISTLGLAAWINIVICSSIWRQPKKEREKLPVQFETCIGTHLLERMTWLFTVIHYSEWLIKFAQRGKAGSPLAVTGMSRLGFVIAQRGNLE